MYMKPLGNSAHLGQRYAAVAAMLLSAIALVARDGHRTLKIREPYPNTTRGFGIVGQSDAAIVDRYKKGFRSGWQQGEVNPSGCW